MIKKILALPILLFGTIFSFMLIISYINDFPNSGGYLIFLIISASLTYQTILWILALFFDVKEEKFEHPNKVYVKVVKVLSIVATIQTCWTLLDILFSI